MLPCRQPATAMRRCAGWSKHAGIPLQSSCAGCARPELCCAVRPLKHCCHGSQGAVLLDPYATAIIGRREFGKLGPVSTAMHVHCREAPACFHAVLGYENSKPMSEGRAARVLYLSAIMDNSVPPPNLNTLNL